MTFQDLLAKVGLAPKTLTEAQDLLAPTKATLDSVAALFSAAGLNLDAMLEAGPDSLKAHLDSIAETDEQVAQALDEAIAKNAELETQIEQVTATSATATTHFATIRTALEANGLTFNLEAPETFSADLKSHITAQAQDLLASSGLPGGVKHVAEEELEAEVPKTDQAKWDHYAALKATDPAKAQVFYDKHLRPQP